METDTIHAAELAQRALAALDAEADARDEENARFGRYFRGELHGNSVRAAERRHNERHLDRVNAVHDLERELDGTPAGDRIIEANHGVGADPEEIRQAIADALAELERT